MENMFLYTLTWKSVATNKVAIDMAMLIRLFLMFALNDDILVGRLYANLVRLELLHIEDHLRIRKIPI